MPIMENTLSNTYYLKALENYPYDLSEAMESLSYALSYDSDHAGAHCLMGRLNMEQLKRYDLAEYHFEQAMISDINYVATYEYYALLLITLKEFDRAEKLISHSYKIKGVNLSTMQHREGLLNEYCRNLKKAKSLMKEAYDNSCCEEERGFIKNELDRVKSKLKSSEKKAKAKENDSL